MTTISAKDFNIKPNKDITVNLAKLISHLSSIDGEKNVIFEKGTYYISSDKCEKSALSTSDKFLKASNMFLTMQKNSLKKQ